MSNHDIDIAYKQTLPTGKKSVLVALAYCRNGKTGQCNPRYQTLSEMTGISRRQLKRIIKAFEKIGLLTVTRTRGKSGLNNANQYAFNWLDSHKPGGPNGASQVTPMSPSGEPSQVSPMTPSIVSPMTPGGVSPMTPKNRNIEPEVRTGISVGKPTERNPKSKTPHGKNGKKEISGKKELPLSTKECAELYSMIEKTLGTKYPDTPSTLTNAEKGQIGDAIRALSLWKGIDPKAALAKAILDWEGFRYFVKKQKPGFKVSEQPDPGHLSYLSRQVADFYTREKAREFEDAKKAAHSWPAVGRFQMPEPLFPDKEFEAAREAESSFYRADPTYRKIDDELQAHKATLAELDASLTDQNPAPYREWTQKRNRLATELTSYMEREGLREKFKKQEAAA